MEKFLLIDGSSLLHRAFFALPPLTAADGQPTGAVYGFCNMLIKLLEDVRPNYLAVAFDKSRVSFRTEVYAAYKGQRKATPPELKSQFALAIELLEALGIAAPELDNYEADDIIGTLAKAAPDNVEIIIVTGDRDELQLVDERTRVFYTKRGISEIEIYDSAHFAEKYAGLKPSQLIELKGLMGDASDNIPGVTGVGEKTALKLIAEYGSVAEVLANVDKIKGKWLQEKLQAQREEALLSRRLAEICTTAPLATETELYRVKTVPAEAAALLQRLEIRRLYARFVAALGTEKTTAEAVIVKSTTPVTLVSAENCCEILTRLAEAATEEVPVCLSFTAAGTLPRLRFDTAELYYDGELYRLATDCGCWQDFLVWLAGETPKAVCGSKELAKIALCNGVKLVNVTEDIALAAYLDQPGRTDYGPVELAERYLSGLPLDTASAEIVARLLPLLRERMQKQELTTIYRNLELPLALVLAQLEYAGIKPDQELLSQLAEDLRHRITRLEKEALTQAGEDFNLRSPKQLAVVLFEHLRLPILKKTKNGASTDVKVLEALADQHPLIPTLLEYRKLSKLQSTYLEGLMPLINPITGRIHTHFQQTVTVTGRLSSTDPNLQNIPARTEEGRQIRRLFVPGEGYDYLLSCDYSQVELRILAAIADDQLLLDSFRQGQDVHARTASEVFGVPLAEVTATLRTRAKAVNFGIVYGMSDFGLAAQLKVSRSEAAGYIKSYFARYQGVARYMKEIVAQARKQGYVTTLLGRRRYLPDLASSNFNVRSAAERTAVNTPIQGTAADIMKVAMLQVDIALKKSGLRSRMLLQVHDELLLEVPEAEREAAAKLVKTAMESAVTLKIPLLAEFSFGRNWADVK